MLTTSVAIVVLWGRTVHCNGGATIARLESEGKTWWPHTCCTMLVRSDMNVAKVQAFVGHAANCAVVEPVNEALEVATPAPVPCAQQKVTQATLCVDCSHRRSNHCTGEPRLHTPEGSGAGFYCTTEHCDGQVLDQQGKCVACPCLAFRATASAPIKQKFPRADDYTPCGHCGHWKSHHCRVRKPSNAKNPKSRDWFGFQDADGKIAMCQHTLPGAEEYCCTSTSCAESTDGEHFCGCQKFLNPLERPRAAKPKAPRSAGAQPWRKCRLNFFNLETLL